MSAKDTEKKRKTSISIDPEVWKDWNRFVIEKTGSARKLSDELEKALKEYMRRKPHA